MAWSDSAHLSRLCATLAVTELHDRPGDGCRSHIARMLSAAALAASPGAVRDARVGRVLTAGPVHAEIMQDADQRGPLVGMDVCDGPALRHPR